MVLEKVIELLVDYKEIDPGTITSDSTFEEIDFDSLDKVELVMQLEEAFDITIEIDDSFKTVGSIVKYIESKIA